MEYSEAYQALALAIKGEEDLARCETMITAFMATINRTDPHHAYLMATKAGEDHALTTELIRFLSTNIYSEQSKNDQVTVRYW